MGWIEYREYYASKRVQVAGVLMEYRKRVCIENTQEAIRRQWKEGQCVCC